MSEQDQQAQRLSDADYDAVVDAARWAPSPDNNQPWALKRSADGDAVEVLHVRSRAIGSDVRDMFSWLAIGAVIENIALAASAHGWQAQVSYHDRPFEKLAGEEHVATIAMERGGVADPLHQHLSARCTNRRPYKREPVAPSRLDSVAAATRERTHVHWLTDREQIKEAAKVIRQADRIRFEHKPFHDELHEVLRYSDAEAERAGDGMSLKALEIPAAMGPVLRFLKPWPRARAMNHVGLSRMFAGIAGQQILNSGALGLLTTDDASDRGYIEAGRSLQRLWLAATGDGLAMQPLGSVPLFLAKLAVDRDDFLPEHAQRVEGIKQEFDRLFPKLGDQSPVMLFRIGVGDAPSARSARFPVEAITR